MSVRLSNAVMANLRAAQEKPAQPIAAVPAQVQDNGKKKKTPPATN